MTYDFDDVSDERRRIMQSIESEGTEPELQAARTLDELGVRYEEHPQLGRFRPDFLLEDGTVLQLFGCFWHACPRHGNTPDTNVDYWAPKFRDNWERDKRRRRTLLGRDDVDYVFRVWEHEDVPERVLALCEYRGLL